MLLQNLGAFSAGGRHVYRPSFPLRQQKQNKERPFCISNHCRLGIVFKLNADTKNNNKLKLLLMAELTSNTYSFVSKSGWSKGTSWIAATWIPPPWFGHPSF